MSGSPRVVIVGGGLAGPCLAHGLRGAGYDVSLHERDTSATSRTQGYRVHITPEGDRALRECLPAHLYELVVATSGRPDSGVTVLDTGLTRLQRYTFEPDPESPAGHLSVDRLTLRQILLSGLDVRFGAACTGYQELPDGRVRVHFDDGTRVDADLLVGADGAGSRVRGRLLPDAVVADTGLWAIFGKTPLTEEARAVTPPAALDGFSTVVAPDGRFLPLAAHRFRSEPDAATARLCPSLRLHDTRDYVMWVFGAQAALLGTDAARLGAMDAHELRSFVADRIADWHPDLGALVRLGDPASVGATRIRSAEPVTHWPTGPVTLIGDAIHCMVPSGTGAGVALHDAGLLTEQLAGVAAGHGTLRQAVHDYEVEMLDYGFAAVAAAANVGGTSRPDTGLETPAVP